VTGDTFGALANMLAGQGLRDTDFQRLTLTDETGSVNNGFVLVSDSTFIDDRITGSVEVIDGGKNRTYSNAAFLTSFVQTALAANYAYSQIWNGSTTKNLILETVTVSSGSASLISMGSWTALINTSIGGGSNKKLGAATGAATFARVNSASVLVTNNMLLANVAANTSFTFPLKEPIIIPPGYGINTWNNNLGNDLTSCFEFYEETIP
jgi:hypothetical protein